MTKSHISTAEDDALRAQVVQTILLGMCEDPQFAEPKTFAKWQRDHREILIGLFGGRGVCNLARLVAWCRREALNLRHKQPEILCLLAASLDSGELPDPIREGLESLNIRTRADLITAAMLDTELSRSLLKPAPSGGLEEIAGSMF